MNKNTRLAQPLRRSPRGATALAALAAAALLASCGGGGTPEGATATGQAEDGRSRALAATTSLAVALPQDADPVFQNLTIPADAATRGMWGPVQDWPMNAIHAAVLPDGKVLSYGAPANSDSQEGKTFDVWTPAQGFAAASHATSFDAARVNSFCSAATWLGDGRLLLSGGNDPRSSSFFAPATRGIATDPAQLADDRWYATMLDLPDGRAVILGGINPYTEGMYQNPDAAIQNGEVSMTPEVYTPGTGWRTLTGARSREAFGPDNLRASYPRAWLAPNGEIFGISADRMWYLDLYANNGTGAVRAAGNGVFKGAPSNTAPVNSGATGTAVMYAPGRVLMVGGNGAANGDGFVASNAATIVDLTGANPVLTETARMSVARRYPNSLVLPNGRVLVTGGTKVGNNGGADANYAAEIWNPATGTWTVGANAARIRVYHSNTVLMPSGVVLSLGGGTPGPVFNQNVEVYYPPYLFAAQGATSVLATRPVMTGINSLTHALGDTMQVEMRDATAVARMVMVRNSITTHSFNPAQRFVELAFTQNGDRISAVLPGSANTMPPGYYQVYALNAAGVPSRAAIVQVKTAPATLPRDVPLTLYATHVADAAMGVDAGNLGVLQTLGLNPTSAQLSTTLFTVRTGLSDAACVSLEYSGQAGRWLRHANFRLQLGTDDGSAGFRGDATFCPERGLAGHSLTLRSKNNPTYVLRERGGQLWIDPEAADAAFRNSATWSPRVAPATGAPLPTFRPLPAAPVQAGGTAVSYNPQLEAAGITFSWTFGDGSAATAFSTSSAASYTYAQPGVYTVTLTARNAAGQTASTSFVQAVYAAPTATAPRHSSQLMLEPRSGASTRLWVVNPDNDSVSVIDTATNTRVAEVAVGAAPRTLARAPNGQVWVVNRDGASISVIDPGTLTVARTTALPRASMPFGIVFSPDGSAAWVALEATGRVAKLDVANGAALGDWAAGATPRHLSISGDSARLLVSRFITAPLPGEGTATVTTTGAGVGAEVWAFNTATMALATTVRLAHSDKTDGENQGSGIPNYLGAAAISPDGRSAWVPSKQDNIKRGTLRNGAALDFQNSVRAISSRIDLAAATPVEVLARRVDHDNASVASAAAYDPTGSYLFVALETSRQVAVVDAARGLELFRIEAGFAPQAVLVSADGQRLYVHNFMSRNLGVVNLAPLMANGSFALAAATTVGTVGTEKLAATVLVGKRLFYDARDPRLARDSYMSCASCHNDGAHDGRTWDFTGFGEGLRNTPSLRGRAAMGQGFAHWSANFDEIQDFEGQIRAFAGGTGLMPDAQFNTGTRNTPLGDKKAGVSADLDALAAYLGSLATFDASPLRNADGTLTAAATAGRTVFANANCVSCHSGAAFSASGDASTLRNVGTLKAASGKRLNGALTGIDVPTLRDVWMTAPYLHDGSAPTLAAAVQAHAGNAVAGADLDNLVAYLQQVGAQETTAPGTALAVSNLAPSATLATSYVSPWETLAAVNNDIVPANSADRTGGSYGNWDGAANFGRTDWVSFTWSTARTLTAFEVYWWNDGQGIGTPTAATVEYYNGSAWVALGSPGLSLNTFNRLDFLPITTTSIRVSMRSALATGILEARVFGTAAAGGSNAAPTVSLTAPAAGGSATVGTAVTLTATAADTDGTVSKVEFYDGTTLIASDTTAPYSISWTPSTAGTRTLTARATDNAGAVTASAGVSFTVNAATTPSNLAPSATLATSFVSPWETLAAVNNNITPANSADKNGGAYGNWDGTANYGRTDWVSFTWASAKTVSAFEVYWWNDGLGIATPTAATVEYWNGTAWVALGSPGLALNMFNRLNFTAVSTTRIRVSMRSARATGILEARVFGN